MSTQQLAASFAVARGVLGAVTPDQLANPSPCRQWDVAAVIDHMDGAARSAVGALSGTELDPETAERDPAALLARYDRTIVATLAAFGAKGALEGTVQLPFAELPAPMFLQIVTTDQFVHAWDVAKATGQSTDLDPVLAACLLEVAKVALPEELRGPDGEAPIGPEQPAPAGASPADRLAAFTGRTV
jgi:uncharacterized protein (TIGR03086 family)